MMIYFFFIFFNIICNEFCLIVIAFINFSFHLGNHFSIHFRKIIHEV